MISVSFNVDLLQLFDRFRGRNRSTLSSRFIQLFESHNVNRNQIPSFFGYELTHADVNNEDLLLKKLNDTSLSAACNLFGVQREWLDCADSRVYNPHFFYNDQEQFALFLDQLCNSGKEFTLRLFLSTNSKWELDTLLLVEEEIAKIGETSIYRFHFCSGWIHRHHKCRPDLVRCIAMILNRKKLCLHGHWVKDSLASLCAGEGLPNLIRALKHDRNKYKPGVWDPDHWIFDIEDFLNGIDGEDFGRANALVRWLEMCKKGNFRTDYCQQLPIKEAESRLRKLQRK